MDKPVTAAQQPEAPNVAGAISDNAQKGGQANDLVERLRIATGSDYPNNELSKAHADLMDEAAKRIRELEAENARLYMANERRVEANDRLLREIERLRDALRGVIREADRNTDAFICARALIATPDSAAPTQPTGEAE